jgi:hypothetical protein
MRRISVDNLGVRTHLWYTHRTRTSPCLGTPAAGGQRVMEMVMVEPQTLILEVPRARGGEVRWFRGG